MTDYPPPPGRPNPDLSGLPATRPNPPAYGPRLHVPEADQPPTKPAPERRTEKADGGQKQSEPSTDAVKTAALQSAIDRARKGDESALPELRELLAGIPSEQTGGDLGSVIVNQMLSVQFKSDLYAKEVVTRKLAEIRQNLTGPKPTPVETLLIDRIACCWLRLHLAEISAGPDEVKAKPLSPAVSRSLDRYQKQYLSSLKALADLRKMNVVIQLNVAKRQSILNREPKDR